MRLAAASLPRTSLTALDGIEGDDELGGDGLVRPAGIPRTSSSRAVSCSTSPGTAAVMPGLVSGLVRDIRPLISAATSGSNGGGAGGPSSGRTAAPIGPAKGGSGTGNLHAHRLGDPPCLYWTDPSAYRVAVVAMARNHLCSNHV